MPQQLIIGGVVIGVVFLVPVLVSAFLRNVEAGTIRIVSWFGGYSAIYRGPGKSKEVPLFTTGTTISSNVATNTGGGIWKRFAQEICC